MKTITNKCIWLLAFLIGWSIAGKSQCTAGFSVALNTNNGAVTFISTSAPTNSTTLYTWNFGNGITYTTVGIPYIQYTYTQSAVYNVSLTVSTSFPGPSTCSAQTTASVPVTTGGGPCSFSPSFTYSILSNGVVSFINTSVGTTTNATYFWNFGHISIADLGYSTLSAPTHTYPPGTYTVTFGVTDGGCSQTNTAVIVVPSSSPCGLQAGFAMPNPSYVGLTTFTNTSTFTNQPSGVTYTWNFGNSAISSATNPTPVNYSAPGNYTVSLTAYSSPTCNSTYTSILVVNPCTLTAGFTATQVQNNAFNFVNQSIGTTTTSSYIWNFGDGNTVTSGIGGSVSHVYTLPGTYTVNLQVINPGSSCSSTFSTVVTALAPCGLQANFSYINTGSGMINFSSTSTGTIPGTTYNWNFGDGQFGTGATPTHSYSSVGNYFVILQVSNSVLCNSTFSTNVSVINCSLQPAFTHTVGSNGQVSFTGSAITSSVPLTFTWNFGDGTTGTGTNPNHTYLSAGAYNVYLIVSNGLCADSSLVQSVNVTGINCIANANFSAVPTATAQYWDFIPAYPWNVIAASWNWGDGITSNTLYASHSYSAAGLYNVCLSVTVSCGQSATACNNTTIYKMQYSASQAMVHVNVVPPSLVPVSVEERTMTDGRIKSVYPNPGNGVFKLEMTEPSEGATTIEVTDITGSVIYRQVMDANANGIREIDLKSPAAGVYFLKVYTVNTVSTSKLIVNSK